MQAATNVRGRGRAVDTALLDAVIVGAGPYGLSAAAHLMGRGLRVAVQGKPMGLWRDRMPLGMQLRSYWWATSLSDPHKRYNIGQFFEELERQPADPLSIDVLIEYGRWFQQHAVPSVDETLVDCVSRAGHTFGVRLVDGRVFQSRTVVLAAGLGYFAYRPAEYAHLSCGLVSHTSEHRTFERFVGKRVAVIGGGQSALETAALLHESGAEVHVVARRTFVWNNEAPAYRRPLGERLRSPQGGIGRGWTLWSLEHVPYAFWRLPRDTKDRLLQIIAGPAGAAWLKPRIHGKVILHERQSVDTIGETHGRVRLSLSGSKQIIADHVMLGTGYQVDIAKLPMLAPSLLEQVQTCRGAPILNAQFESTVPGLYFLGAASVWSFGPLFRFIVGTDAAARRTAGAVARRSARVG